MTERWMPVLGFEGRFEVSDEGRVRGLARKGKLGQSLRPRIIRGWVTGFGYPMVELRDADGNRRKVFVHRLVLEAFVGPCPEGKEGCHNDGDRLNARASNLRWDTRTNNNLDTIAHGNNHWKNKAACPLGHPLTFPNVPRGSRRRYCIACHRGRAWWRRHPGTDLQSVADSYFRNIWDTSLEDAQALSRLDRLDGVGSRTKDSK